MKTVNGNGQLNLSGRISDGKGLRIMNSRVQNGRVLSGRNRGTGMNARTRASGGLVATTLAATTAQEATTGGTAAGTTGGRTLAATIAAGTAAFRKE